MADPLEKVNARVANMPAELQLHLLRRAGIQQQGPLAGAPEAERPKQHSWGFPTNLPPRQRLVEYLEEQAAAAAAAAADAKEEHQRQQRVYQQAGWKHPRRQPAQQQQAAVAAALQERQQQQRPILLELLQQSRTFQSPDCADAMAEALGVADLHRGLRGSLLQAAPPEAAVQRTRSLLRGALQAAWSQEALRRGVALAKAGDLRGALPCYDQALQLDSGNADALVARGAALANQRQWQRASDDLEAALQLQPEHSNARQYLEAVQAKAQGAGVRLQAARPSSGQVLVALDGEQKGGEGQEARPANGRGRAGMEAEEEEDEGVRQQWGPAPPLHARDRQQEFGDRERREPEDGRGNRKRRRGSRSSSRSWSRRRSSSRGRRGRSSSRSRDRRRSSSRGSSSGGSGSSNDSEAEATAARLAAAAVAQQQQGADGAAGGFEGMDVATALHIVSSHYKSRRGSKRGKAKQHKREHGGGGKRSKHHRHKKDKHKSKKQRHRGR